MSPTPIASAAALCSVARISTIRSEIIARSFEPLLPVVHWTYVISVPFAAHSAAIAPAPISASSGWANITIARRGTSSITSYFVTLLGVEKG